MQRVSSLGHKEVQELRRDTTTHYGGHIVWKDSSVLLVQDISLDYTDANATRAVIGATNITSLAGKYPEALQDLIKGAVIFGIALVYGHANKVAEKTNLVGRIKYSVEYGTVPDAWNIVALANTFGQAAGVDLSITGGGQAVIPVQWRNAVPYITWNIVMANTMMVTNSARYYAQGNLYLQGFTV